jgi:UDP-N-acetylglucosamine diphosphorylase/glucosamine-1-phosphate N-acetyltransferase
MSELSELSERCREKDVVIVLMAGGLGKRMESDLPKVLHKINGVPMLVKILGTIRELEKRISVAKVMVVVGKYREIIEKTVNEYMDVDNWIQWVDQPQALGTGHALQCCLPFLCDYLSSNVLILSGDVPLIRVKTMLCMITSCGGVRIITTHLSSPSGYGRILVSGAGEFVAIVEEKDCDAEQKKITEVNGGIYCFDCLWLCKYLPLLKNDNSQGEYYLTDIVRLIREGEGVGVERFVLGVEKQYEILGVNTRQQLLDLESSPSMG